MPEKTIPLKIGKEKLNVNVMMIKSGICVQFQINNASCSETFKVGKSKNKTPESLYAKFDQKAALEFVQEKVKTRFKQMKVVPDQIKA